MFRISKNQQSSSFLKPPSILLRSVAGQRLYILSHYINLPLIMKAETKNVTRVWPCSECSKAFGRKGDLTRHELLHLGYKPHKCDAPGCGKEFSQFSGLKTHKNVHTKEKPYVCRINGCVASFGDPSSCARHRKETHFRTGGYHCPVPRCNSR
ncbi:hypothetical protein GALMADRAFT_688854 [Galerina marginata CBS 339.88]|uniref:C2H2-type domain-containing protein n=1 Tax=Galerina marginata (strain CBS 339.88) TaxID=685588 RepID=A0A067TLH5_GALM3|nr:hypothetical protein GALMADRAFT_688854 [Galerina marginata CBS 339.88]